MPLYSVAPSRRDTVSMSDVQGPLLHYSIPALEMTGEPELVAPEDIASAKLRLRGGEVMVSRLNPRKGRIVRVPQNLSVQAFASTEFVVLVPRSIDNRFLAYLLESEPVRQRLDSQVRSVTRSHQRVDPEVITQMRVDLPDREEQGRIADFLDDQLARIDRIARERARQLELLDMLRVATIWESLDAWSPSVALSWVLTNGVQDGPHETPDFVPDGVPLLSVDSIVDDRIQWSGTRFITPAAHREYARKCRPRRGDVLLTKAATVGKVALVDTDRDFNIWSPIAVLRTQSHRLRPDFLAWALRSPQLQEQMAQKCTNTTQNNLAMRDIASLRIPLPSVEEQERVAELLNGIQRETEQGHRLLRKANEKVAEYRTSLITAALIGEVEALSAAGKGVRR